MLDDGWGRIRGDGAGVCRCLFQSEEKMGYIYKISQVYRVLKVGKTMRGDLNVET